MTPVMCGRLAMFEKFQRIQAFAECCVDVEEVCRDDALCLGGEELARDGGAAM